MPQYEYSADEIKQLSDDLTFLDPRQQRLLGALLRLGLDSLDNGASQTENVIVDDPFDGANDAPTFSDLIDRSFRPGKIDEGVRTTGEKVGSSVSIIRTDGTR